MRICASLILLVIASTADAQVKYGFKGGVNFSDVVINNVTSPDAESDFKMKAGFHGGVFALVDGPDQVGLALELLYSNKGVRGIDNNIRLHYAAVPILVRYHFNDRLVGEAGPEIAYLVTANSKYGNLNSTWDNKVDVGLDAGIQYELDRLSVGTRFNAGFSSVIRNATDASSGAKVRYQNPVLQFFLAFRIGD